MLCTVHASWLQQRDCRIKQLLTVTGRVTAAANAAIESITRVIRDNAADDANAADAVAVAMRLQC